MFDIDVMSEYEFLETLYYYWFLSDNRLNYATMLDAFEKDLTDSDVLTLLMMT